MTPFHFPGKPAVVGDDGLGDRMKLLRRPIADNVTNHLPGPTLTSQIYDFEGHLEFVYMVGSSRAFRIAESSLSDLKKSLDEIFAVEYPKTQLKDAIESKLFGIGSEAMVVGSHDFYLGYAIKNNKLITLDNGHFHPSEQVGDKISSILQFVDELMLHVTRGVRWDSDHVVTFNDEIQLIAQEIVRSKALKKVNIGLDYFDASINRIGAYVIGIRTTRP